LLEPSVGDVGYCCLFIFGDNLQSCEASITTSVGTIVHCQFIKLSRRLT